MRFYPLLWSTALVLLPGLAMANPPFPLEGFHTQMKFQQATDHASQLGALCKDIRASRKRGGVRAACDFSHCKSSGQELTCEQVVPGSTPLLLAGQPVTLVEFEAPAKDKRVTSIAVFFAGEHAAVLQHLVTTFGEPDNDTGDSGASSWSKARRLFWQQGKQRVGLLDNPKMILLAFDG